MKKEQLKTVFTKPYNREDWQDLIRNVFPGTSFFAEPYPIPVPKEEIEEFYHTGNIRLNDGKSLAIFELHVSDRIKLKINRVALHTIISKYIDQESHHGVLALFDSNSEDYRFTFTAKDSQITEAGFETKATDAKRYTYVFGPNETCRTAVDRFDILANKRDSITIDDVEDAFSVEKLNKEFFKQYKEQYEKFVCFITGKHFVKKRGKWKEEVVHEPHEYLGSIFENDDKQARDFIKKSLGRLVFLYFLQKKGWMGCSPDRTDWNNGDQKFMQHYFDNCQDKDYFHSKFLVPLYFECLNLKRKNDNFEPTNSRIPYLNGGLFEEDKLKTNKIDFPTKYWENLFNFFDQYNFTIDENDPFEQEVGIDPEMLGHIFENLLEDNKDKGAFYTPKPIVEYMCKESLIQYLKTHLLPENSPLQRSGSEADRVLNSPLQRGGSEADGVLNSPLKEEYGFSRGVFKNYKKLPYNPELKERAKELRKAGNLSEVLFWNKVKNKQFLNLDFHRQKIIGNYIVDFYLPALQLVVEIDGSSHNEKIKYDKEREDFLKNLGLNIIHYSDADVKQNLNGVMEHLKELCEKLVNTPPDKSGTPLQEGNLQALENFIRNHDPGDPEDKNNYIRNNAEKIEKLLDDVKICDPAIGSGAFPMGLLQEIFWAKMTLDWTLNPAETKKKIIENSIYGVDIDSGAIDIARLRFWLSLIVDAEEPEPLPNLDYKIMQGNSLLESFEGIDLSNVLKVDYKPKTIVEEPEQADLFDNEPKQQALVLEDNDVNSIVELKHTLFQSSDPKEKEDCKKEIDKIVMENIEFNLNIKRDKLNIEIDRIKNKIRDSVKMLHSYSQTKEFLKKNRDVKKLREKKKELHSLNPKYKKLAELQHTTDRPFFLWHLYFSEVFENTPSRKLSGHPSARGEFNGGFDIVIGNPPYVQLQKDHGKLADLYADQNFETFERTGDIYSLFYEKGFNLLTVDGHLCYITSNKWMRAGYGRSLRNYFALKTNPLILLDFGQSMIFENAIVHSNIIIIQNAKNNNNTLSFQFTENNYKRDVQLYIYINKYANQYNFLKDEIWVILNSKEKVIKDKFIEKGTPLYDWDVSIYRGLLTGLNEAFIINGDLRSKLISQDSLNDKILKPVLRGRDTRRYYCNYANYWLINSHNGLKTKKIKRINIPDEYPFIYKHLLQYKDKAMKRQDKGDHWTNLRNCAYLEEIEKPKIVFSEIVSEPQFYYDIYGFFPEATVFFISGDNLKYLTAMLNSKAVTFVFRKFYAGGELVGKYRYKKAFLRKIPIPESDENIEKKINALVDQILSDKEVGKDTQKLEDQIDLMVYKLYELTYEEAKIVDPELDKVLAEFSLSKADFERMGVEELAELKLN